MPQFEGRPAPKPLGLKLLPILLGIYAVTTILFLILGLQKDISLSLLHYPLSSSVHRIVVRTLLLGSAIIELVAAYGFVKDRLWARPLATGGMAAWTLVFAVTVVLVTPASLAEALVGILGAVPMLVLLALYLYRRAPVRLYYQSLQRRTPA